MSDIKEEQDRYFPDDPKNKVFAVDVWVTAAKCLKVEAKNREDAEAKAEKFVVENFLSKPTPMVMHLLNTAGFEATEDAEFHVSGEANELGEIWYY